MPIVAVKRGGNMNERVFGQLKRKGPLIRRRGLLAPDKRQEQADTARGQRSERNEAHQKLNSMPCASGISFV